MGERMTEMGVVGKAGSRRLRLGAWCAGVLIVLAAVSPLSLLPVHPAAAQQTSDAPVREEVGPYLVDAVVTVGGSIVRVAATVWEADTGAPASGLQVTAHTRHAGDGATGWVRALPDPANPGLYEAVILLETAGEWDVSLEVDGPAGGGDAFLQTVTFAGAPDSFVAQGVIYVVSLVIVAGAVWVWWSSKRALRRQQEVAARPTQ